MLEVRIFAEATYKDISDDAKIQLRPVSFEVSKRCTKEETIAKYQAKAEADWESALDEHPMGQDIDSLAVIMQVNPARGIRRRRLQARRGLLGTQQAKSYGMPASYV